MKRIPAIVAVLAVVAVALSLLVQIVGQGNGQPSVPALLITDLLSFGISIIAIALAVRAIRHYGGVLGEGFSFVLAGIVLIALYEASDMILHFFNPLSTATFFGVREAIVENIAVGLALISMLYGFYRMKTD